MRAQRFVCVSVLLIAGPAALLAQGTRPGLERDLDRLRQGEQVSGLPPADSVTQGPRRIAAGTTVTGTVVARGAVDVFGKVTGSVVSLGGDVVVHPGGSIGGDALSVGGHVMADSGLVGGEMRTMTSLPSVLGKVVAAADLRSPAQRTADSARLVASCFVVLLFVAMGVVLFAGHNLDEVVNTIETRFAASFWYGVLGQILALPALLVLVIGLVLTLLGILLVPFAVVAYGIGVAGILTSSASLPPRGWSAGSALYSGPIATPKARAMIALTVGVALFFVLWMAAALFESSAMVALALRAIALAVTWVAMTLGLGAALISRAGTHRQVAGGARPMELAAWQTPTPVTGVAAARRTAGTPR